MTIPNENERLDTVNDGIRIYQYKDGQLFGSDALLLAGYVRGRAKRAAELGSGSGILSLLLLQREKAARIDCFELQGAYCELTRRNAALNGFGDRLRVVEGDLRETSCLPGRSGAYDLVVANPPYMPRGGKECETPSRQIARHEVCGGVADFTAAAGRLLQTGGYYEVVCRPDRLTDLLCAMREAAVEPKKLTPVSARRGEAPCLILVEGKKGGNPGLRWSAAFSMDGGEYDVLMRDGSFPAQG